MSKHTPKTTSPFALGSLAKQDGIARVVRDQVRQASGQRPATEPQLPNLDGGQA